MNKNWPIQMTDISQSRRSVGLDILLANDYEQKLNLQNIARPLYFFLSSGFLAFSKINIFGRK